MAAMTAAVMQLYGRSSLCGHVTYGSNDCCGSVGPVFLNVENNLSYEQITIFCFISTTLFVSLQDSKCRKSMLNMES